MKKFFKKGYAILHLELILVFLFIFILATVTEGLLVCPFLLLLKIPCPFCGMTRAFSALISGDIVAAYNYHPLFWLVIVDALAIFLSISDNTKLRKISIFVLIFSLLIFILVWIFRD